MSITLRDVDPFSQSRTHFLDLVDEMVAGSEKIITRNGETCVALIDVRRLDYYHRLERERIHLVLLDEVEKGLSDVTAGRAKDARNTLMALKAGRRSSAFPE